MTAKSPTSTAAESSSAPTDEDNSATLREIFEKLISGDPRFKEAEKSGEAFVIGGAKPRR
jgi:hypothetical protein